MGTSSHNGAGSNQQADGEQSEEVLMFSRHEVILVTKTHHGTNYVQRVPFWHYSPDTDTPNMNFPDGNHNKQTQQGCHASKQVPNHSAAKPTVSTLTFLSFLFPFAFQHGSDF
jgi:hypothetical protein